MTVAALIAFLQANYAPEQVVARQVLDQDDLASAVGTDLTAEQWEEFVGLHQETLARIYSEEAANLYQD